MCKELRVVCYPDINVQADQINQQSVLSYAIANRPDYCIIPDVDGIFKIFRAVEVGVVATQLTTNNGACDAVERPEFGTVDNSMPPFCAINLFGRWPHPKPHSK